MNLACEDSTLKPSVAWGKLPWQFKEVPPYQKHAGSSNERFSAQRLSVLRVDPPPLLVPGIVTAGIFIFNIVWNEFIFALILAQDESR